ncbi:MAG: hypothetical protein AAGG07_12180 [Planctomycetota bacterium]
MDQATQDRVNTALASKDWRAVVELLAPLGDAGPHERALRLARNMTAIQERDPGLASELNACGESGRVAIVRLPDGTPTIGLLGPDGVPVPITNGGATVAKVAQGIGGMSRPREALGLLGVGDGSVLRWLSDEQRDELGYERAIFVVEPVTELFRSMLVIADLWADGGPLRANRFKFFVGASGMKRLDRWADEHPDCPPPGLAMPLRSVDKSLLDRLSRVHRSFGDRLPALTERAVHVSKGRSPGDVASRLLSPGARVLLLTTRFSTVLQHSTRDFADAFNAEGYDATVIIEPEACCRHTKNSLLDAIDRVRPDLVIQIDHHRHEMGAVVPPEVPFVCVIQDNLPNLTTPDAAAQLGPLDFSTGPWVHRYVREFGYPEERCFELPRLTREPTGISGVSPGDDKTVLYVSNHSGTPGQTLDKVLSVLGESGRGADLARVAAAEMISLYENGRCLENSSDVLNLTRRCAERIGVAGRDPGALTNLSELLATHVNNALYRQQALRWAADACSSLGLELIIYGAGWEEHPEFARFAAGPIAYGPDLIERTRAAAFSLMLEPFFPTSHQRALDIWMWGGLPLLRGRARDRQQDVFQSWVDRLRRNDTSYAEAIESLGAEDREAFERVYLAQLALDPDAGELDLVELYARRRRAGLGDLMRSPPMIDQNSFVDASALHACMKRLLASAEDRARVAEAQHTWIRERFSYRAGVRLLMDRLTAQLEHTAEGCPA